MLKKFFSNKNPSMRDILLLTLFWMVNPVCYESFKNQASQGYFNIRLNIAYFE